MRAAIARRLSASKHAAPHFYVTEAVDMSAAVHLRERLCEELSREPSGNVSGKPAGEGVEVGFTDMIIRAAALALRELPRVAFLFTPEGFAVRDHMNVGLAVALEEEGLIVPVIRDADRKGLAEIAAAARDLARKARAHTLTTAECLGGVFTVSNLGMHGVEQFTAIINPGESAILAVGSLRKAPAVVEDRLEIRPLMRVTLSSDHRVIDGVLAARFVGRIKALLENPEGLL
jgi:pyruvate dehydrogenase E2 component (dihydrolipoamide acetyltransferase)